VNRDALNAILTSSKQLESKSQWRPFRFRLWRVLRNLL